MEKLKKLPIQTAVRAIIVNNDLKVMLIKRADGTYEGGKWCLIGGKPDKGEKLDEAMTRELQEEVGSEFTLSYWTGVENPDTSTGVRWITHYFIGKSENLPTQFDTGSVSEVKFFSQKELYGLDIAFDHKDVLARYFGGH